MKNLPMASLLAFALAAPAAGGEFEVLGALDVRGGAEISTQPGSVPILFASPDLPGRVGIATAAPSQALSVAGVVEASTGGFKLPDGTWQTTAYAPSVLQTRVYSDYTVRTTGNGGYYYFGAAGQYDNFIKPYKTDSIILISINYFGETQSAHDTHTRLEYSIGGGAWTSFDIPGFGQNGTMKLGNYPDADYNSTPHNASTQVAKAFNTTQNIAFRMYHFNGGTFYHNGAVAYNSYESGPSTLMLEELDAERSSYAKR